MQQEIAKPRSELRPALTWMAGALFSFILVAIAGREAAQGATTLEMMLYRGVISLIVVLALVMMRSPGLAAMRTERLGQHMIRAAAHFAGQFAWLYALPLITLAQLFALEFTAPLWVAVLAPVFLKERLTATRLLAAGIGFAGAILVARPGAMGLSIGVASALFAAIGFAVSMICTKGLTRTEEPLRILFYMFVFQTGISILLLAGGARLLDAQTMAWTAGLALAGLSAHYCLVRAFALADAIIVAPMDFLRLPLIALVGVALYSEVLDPLILIGGAIVVGANILNLWGERRSAG